MSNRTESRWLVHAVAGALCLMLLGAGWWLGLRPVANQKTDVASLRKQVQTAEVSLRQKTAEFEKLNTQVQQTQARLENRPMQLRSANTLNAQLGRYSDLAEQCGLALSTTRVGDLAASGDHRYFPVTLGGSGPLVGVLNLLEVLHREHPDTAIHFIDMTRTPGEGSARFELKLVWLVAEAPDSTASVVTDGQ